jgi:hypothetical protein
MTTDHDSDPDATVRMPRPAPRKEDLEDIDPESTLIREDWGNATILPPPSATQPESPEAPSQQSPQTGM